MSPATRAYLPLERGQLSDLHSGGTIKAGVVAFWVTDEARSLDQSSDEEELEFLALHQAARHAREQHFPVIIAAVDLPASAVAPGTPSPFVTAGEVPASVVVAFHLSDDAIDGSGVGDPEVLEEPEEQAALELSWFDITELSQILRQ